MVSVPSLAHYMGRLGHLLFEPAIGWVASGVSGVLYRTCDMAALGVTSAACAPALCCVVSGRGGLVDIYSALSKSTLASRSCRDATGHHRWRPRPYYRCPEFRIP